jgi:hypothetical protein
VRADRRRRVVGAYKAWAPGASAEDQHRFLAVSARGERVENPNPARFLAHAFPAAVLTPHFDRRATGPSRRLNHLLRAKPSYRVSRLDPSETIRSRIATSRTRNSLLRARWARVPAAIRRAFARASSILRLIGDSLKPPIPPRLNEPEGPRSQSVVVDVDHSRALKRARARGGAGRPCDGRRLIERRAKELAAGRSTSSR